MRLLSSVTCTDRATLKPDSGAGIEGGGVLPILAMIYILGREDLADYLFHVAHPRFFSFRLLVYCSYHFTVEWVCFACAFLRQERVLADCPLLPTVGKSSRCLIVLED